MERGIWGKRGSVLRSMSRVERTWRRDWWIEGRGRLTKIASDPGDTRDHSQTIWRNGCIIWKETNISASRTKWRKCNGVHLGASPSRPKRTRTLSQDSYSIECICNTLFLPPDGGQRFRSWLLYSDQCDLSERESSDDTYDDSASFQVSSSNLFLSCNVLYFQLDEREKEVTYRCSSSHFVTVIVE